MIVAIIDCPDYFNEIGAYLGIGDSPPRHDHGVWVPREPTRVGGEAIHFDCVNEVSVWASKPRGHKANSKLAHCIVLVECSTHRVCDIR